MLGAWGWGCCASFLSSTLGMGVDVMDVNGTEGKSVSWVCAMGGAHLSWPLLSLLMALLSLCILVGTSKNFKVL